MPGVRVFVDTNVFLYARQLLFDAKRERAVLWLEFATNRQIAATNLQVLNELTNALLRKRGDLTSAEVFAAVDDLAPLGTSPITDRTVVAARHLRTRHGYSWWDCLLLASAIELGCTHFLSEDLQDGHQIAGLTIVDPFAHTPEQILTSL